MRKSFPKILIAFFLTVFVLQIICLFFLLAAPVASQAIEFKPQIPIPGAGTSGFKSDGSYEFKKDDSTAPIAMYIRIIYNYAIGIIGILAAVVLMIGGVLWIVAGGNATQIGEAKAWIGASLTGLVLALTSYLILSTVNPALVNLQTTGIPGVTKLTEKTSTSILKEAYGDSLIIRPNVNLEGMNVNATKGIVEVKDICNIFYGGNDCKITITGGAETDSSGNSFTVGDYPTGITSMGGKNYTIGDIIFKLYRGGGNIREIDNNNVCLTSKEGIKYKLNRWSTTITVTVVPSC